VGMAIMVAWPRGMVINTMIKARIPVKGLAIFIYIRYCKWLTATSIVVVLNPANLLSFG